MDDTGTLDKTNERSHDFYLRMIREEREQKKARGDYRDVLVKEDPVDMVSQPPHYNQGDIECIDAIESALGKEGFQYYLQGNILKYVWRYRHKNKIEDLGKSQFYLNKLIEVTT